jgi:ribosomal-protein-alanine N-acetyltransferase
MFHKVFSFLGIPYKDKRNDSNANGNAGGVKIQFKYLTKDKKNKRLKEVFSNLPRFETRRLILRRIEERDCGDMFEYSADENVTRYLTWQPHTNISETKNYLSDLQKKYDSGRFYDWGLVYKEDGRLVGTCGFTSINLNKNTCEVGYVLAKKYWGRGLMPEALECVMDFAFDYFGFDKVEARFLDGNEKSKKVMLKAGMIFEKTEHNVFYIKSEYKTVHTYSITKSAFETRKNALNKIVLNKIN